MIRRTSRARRILCRAVSGTTWPARRRRISAARSTGTPNPARRLIASVLVISSPEVRTAALRGSAVSPRSTQLSCSQYLRRPAIRRQ